MGCLGTASAEALHDAAHRVIVTHSPVRAEVQAWLDAHAAKGRRFLSYAMDVADAASCAACAERVRGDGHVVDILINNAGITRDVSFRTMCTADWDRSEEHTSELQSLMRISYAVFCLKKKKN